MATVPQVLRALAELSPSGGDSQRDLLDVTTGGRPLVWLGTSIEPTLLLDPMVSRSPPDVQASSVGTSLGHGEADGGPRVTDRGMIAGLRRAGATDALHREEQLLRVGWGWLSGQPDGPGAQPTLRPLLSAPAQIVDRLGTVSVVRCGDIEGDPLTSSEVGSGLVDAAELGGGALHEFDLTTATLRQFPKMTAWLRSAARAAGHPDVTLLGPEHAPSLQGADPGVAVVVGLGVYMARDVQASGLETTLKNWAAVPGVERSALAQVLLPEQAHPTHPGDGPDPLTPPVRLSAAQRAAVDRARREQITVVSGPPGSGKSHTVTAMALDAVAAGRSVLVATQTGHAADVLIEALHRLPGPAPVAFGGSRRRTALATELAGGLDAGATRGELAADRQAADAATERARWLWEAIAGLLRTEQQAATHRAGGALPALLLADAPGLADTDADLPELRSLADESRQQPTGFWSRRRRRRAERRLRDSLRAAADVPLERVVAAIDAASARRAAMHLAAHGGTVIGSLWDELERAEDEARLALGALLTDTARSGGARDGASRRAVQDLATALRAGRATRREHLRRIQADDLLAALPLWVGTVRDIEDLLPDRPGLFDLVILDEASQLDLPRAALALLRARRAVVVGDPAQLRHVSFVADADVEQVLERHGLAPMLGRLDVRRVSAFDAAAGVAPVLWLDEHFRSTPHLVEFSARRFYDGVVHVATRHPTNERADVIDTVRAEADVDGKVHLGEVREVERIVRQLVADGCPSIGVVSPFRDQADALEAMLLDGFTLDEIERHELRVGTVHAFQGGERDVVVLSLGLGPDDPAGRRRFVEDPNLFNVMVTRAKRRLIVVTSLVDPPEGLVAEYLEHAEHAPGPTAGGACDDPWTTALATELRRSGLMVRTAYPVGRWTVDVVLGDGADAVAIETTVHPDGPDVHVERHLQLRRSGWRLLEGWSSRFDDDPVAGALALVDEAHR